MKRDGKCKQIMMILLRELKMTEFFAMFNLFAKTVLCINECFKCFINIMEMYVYFFGFDSVSMVYRILRRCLFNHTIYHDHHKLFVYTTQEEKKTKEILRKQLYYTSCLAGFYLCYMSIQIVGGLFRLPKSFINKHDFAIFKIKHI